MPIALEDAVETLPGVGPVTGRLLRERGYGTVGDLVWLLPRRYDDQRTPTPIPSLVDGQYAVTEGVVRAARTFYGRSKRGFEVRVVASESEGSAGELKLVWFSLLPGLLSKLKAGARVRVAGRVRVLRGVPTIAHPEMLGSEGAGRIEPRYSEIPGIRVKSLRRAVCSAVGEAAAQVPDLVPEALRRVARLCTVAEALRQVHQPGPDLRDDELDALLGGRSPAHRRLALEELLLWELALRTQTGSDVGRAIAFDSGSVVETVSAALPFELTRAQHRAAKEILDDLALTRPMRRLLQGDVGCGKTAVAMIACMQVARGGAQTAFLAPTELLAEQHAATIEDAARQLGLRVALLTGSLSAGRQQAVRDRLCTGAADLVIGTHALLSPGVRFANLGLVIVDEQHRFGVAQRLRLSRRTTDTQPHLLVMTATPIPRSLALVLYAGLSLSTIDEKPPGRLPVTTRMVQRGDRSTVLRHVQNALRACGRAYVICPAVTGSSELIGVEGSVEEIGSYLGADRVGVLHSSVPADERRELMRAFAVGEIDALVGTTVLEVGVDVPAANIIVIEQAERFGLAQLHQLRGRVGRAGQRSACLLTYDEPLTEDARGRLEALCETEDGFVLAEKDLELRGPGQLFGYRQSGTGGLRFAALTRDTGLLEQARALADAMLAKDPELLRPAHANARKALERWSAQTPVSREAG